MNKPFKFKDRKEYIEYLNKKGFHASSILYLDANSTYEFYKGISESQVAAYYGSFLNDTTEIRKTDSLKENLSCAGRILKDIYSNTNSVKFDSSFLTKSNFKRFLLKRLDNNEPFSMNTSEPKLKIVMLYGFSLGSLYDTLYKEVLKFHEEHKSKTELYIISLDPVSSLEYASN